MEKFIKVIQGGVARWLRGVTPLDIGGLFTDNLETCVAVIIVGSKGITLIHDTRRLSIASVMKEFRLIGEVDFWSIGYNPDGPGLREAPDKINREILIPYTDRLEREDVSREKYRPPPGAERLVRTSDGKQYQVGYYQCIHGFISINKDAHIKTEVRPPSFLFDEKIYKRFYIGYLNDLFSDDNNLPPDVFYDGRNFTALPELDHNPEKMFALLHERRVKFEDKYDYYFITLTCYVRWYIPSAWEDIRKRLFNSPSERDVGLLGRVDYYYAICNRCKTLDYAQVVRRIAAWGTAEELNELFNFCYYSFSHSKGEPWLVQSPSGKTALHFAVEKNNVSTARYLMGRVPPAVDILDEDRKFPVDYITDRTSDEIRRLFINESIGANPSPRM